MPLRGSLVCWYGGAAAAGWFGNTDLVKKNVREHVSLKIFAELRNKI